MWAASQESAKQQKQQGAGVPGASGGCPQPVVCMAYLLVCWPSWCDVIQVVLPLAAVISVLPCRGLCQHEGSMYLVLEYCPRWGLFCL